MVHIMRVVEALLARLSMGRWFTVTICMEAQICRKSSLCWYPEEESRHEQAQKTCLLISLQDVFSSLFLSKVFCSTWQGSTGPSETWRQPPVRILMLRGRAFCFWAMWCW